MIAGEIYEAPWGRYVVHRAGVLRSLDAPNAFIVDPGDAYKRTGESIAQQHVVRLEIAVAEVSPAIEAEVPPGMETLTPQEREWAQTGLDDDPELDEPELEPPMTLTLGGFRPGIPLFLLPCKEQLWWRPCLRRGENGDTHVWYLSSTRDGSLLCHSCRIGAPRVVIGPKEWIAEIREAIDADDIERTSKLLARGAA